jgi:hypothetical protein
MFSRGHLVLPHVCNHLSAKSTRAVLCLSAWSLMGFVKDHDIRKLTKLPEGPDDGGIEGDIDIEDEDNDWEALYDSPIVLD